VDRGAVEAAVRGQAGRPTPGATDMATYLPAQVADASHREVVGPLLDGAGPSGVVLHRGERIASWGDPSRPEMAFSATKSVVALVAGVAFDRGLLRLDRRVSDDVDLAALEPGSPITWQHLLQQTSGARTSPPCSSRSRPPSRRDAAGVTPPVRAGRTAPGRATGLSR